MTFKTLSSSVRYIFLIILGFLLSNCKSNEVAYRYHFVPMAVDQPGRNISKWTASSFVCLNENIYEYEIVTHDSAMFGRDGAEISRKISFDTVGLFLWKPESGSYYKIATRGSKVQFVDSGRIDQAKSGVSFKSPQSESTAIDPKACRDTLLDGIKLKLYESAEGDTLLIRHYFFKEMPVNSILTYATAKRFTGQKGLFRVELFSRKDSATSISTLRDIERLTPKEVSAFRKLLPNTTL